jgi:hypothetical protein
MAQHHGLETGAAHFVYCHAADGYGNACLERGLACRRLAESGRQDAAHDDLADISAINSRLLNSSPDGGSAQFIGVYSLELPLERSDGCPPGADDYDISHVVSFV